MTTPTAARKALPKGNSARVRVVHNHLAGHGFGEGRRAGIAVTARDDVVSVGVARRQFTDPGEMERLTRALTTFAEVRLVEVSRHGGDMFDTYTYIPAPDAETTTGRTPVDDHTHVTITVEEYRRLKEAADTLARLENAGVDNWEGYDVALSGGR